MDYPEGTIIDSTGKAPTLGCRPMSSGWEETKQHFPLSSRWKESKAKETGLVAWLHVQNNLSRGAVRW